MKRATLGRLLAGRFEKEDLKHEQTRTDHDGAVGDVEGGPLMRTNIEEKEINNAAANQTVPEIADGAAQDEGQTDAR